ncbi:TRAP transporter small permease [Paracoccaceae bacterium GXU_MW_L88]
MTNEITRRRPFGLLRQLITGWALLGGAILIGIVLVNVWAVIAPLIGMSFAGDFELTEVFIAIAAFMFLPYTQLMDENVTADIFTSKAGPGTLRFLTAIAGVVALIFAGLLIWRMTFGMLDQKAYNATTAILQLPIWLAYIPILISIALLGLAALLTIYDNTRGDSHVE